MFSWATHAAVMPLKSRCTPASTSLQSGCQILAPFKDAPRTPYCFFIWSKLRPSTSACGAVSFDAGMPLEGEHSVVAVGDQAFRLGVAARQEDLDETRPMHIVETLELSIGTIAKNRGWRSGVA